MTTWTQICPFLINLELGQNQAFLDPPYFDHVDIERSKVNNNKFHTDKQAVILCLLLYLLLIDTRSFDK